MSALDLLISERYTRKSLTDRFVEHLIQVQKRYQKAFQDHPSYDLTDALFINDITKISNFFEKLTDQGVSNITFDELAEAGLNTEIIQLLLGNNQEQNSLNPETIQLLALLTSDFAKFHQLLPETRDLIISPEQMGLDSDEKVEAFKNIFKINRLTIGQAEKIIKEIDLVNLIEKYPIELDLLINGQTIPIEDNLKNDLQKFLEIKWQEGKPLSQKEINKLQAVRDQAEQLNSKLARNEIDRDLVNRYLTEKLENYHSLISRHKPTIDQALDKRHGLLPEKANALHQILQFYRHLKEYEEGIKQLEKRLNHYEENEPLLNELGIQSKEDAQNLLSMLKIYNHFERGFNKLENNIIENLLKETRPPDGSIATKGLTLEETYHYADKLNLDPESFLDYLNRFQKAHKRINLLTDNEKVPFEQILDKIKEITQTLQDPEKKEQLITKVGGASRKYIDTLRDILNLHQIISSTNSFTGLHMLSDILQEDYSNIRDILKSIKIPDKKTADYLNNLLKVYNQVEKNLRELEGNHNLTKLIESSNLKTIARNDTDRLLLYLGSDHQIVYPTVIAQALNISPDKLNQIVKNFAEVFQNQNKVSLSFNKLSIICSSLQYPNTLNDTVRTNIVDRFGDKIEAFRKGNWAPIYINQRLSYINNKTVRKTTVKKLYQTLRDSGYGASGLARLRRLSTKTRQALVKAAEQNPEEAAKFLHEARTTAFPNRGR